MPVEGQNRKARGSCHCGAVRFEVALPAEVTVLRCNCSICSKSGHLHLIVPAANLRVLSGEEQLVAYRFNSRKARHQFCKVCGVKPYYVPRSHPEGFSINFNCLRLDEQIAVTIREFDGRHWRKNITSITHDA